MKATKKQTTWTEPKHLFETDREDLRSIKADCDAGNYRGAFATATNLDTIVRDEIPSDLWKKMVASSTSATATKMDETQEQERGWTWMMAPSGRMIRVRD